MDYNAHVSTVLKNDKPELDKFNSTYDKMTDMDSEISKHEKEMVNKLESKNGYYNASKLQPSEVSTTVEYKTGWEVGWNSGCDAGYNEGLDEGYEYGKQRIEEVWKQVTGREFPSKFKWA